MLYDPKPGDEYYTGTQRKRKRDPNAPKKPPNAYLIYSKQRREEIKVDMPDMAPKDIMSELGRGSLKKKFQIVFNRVVSVFG